MEESKGIEIEDSGTTGGAGIIMGEPTGDLEPPIKEEAAAEPEIPTAREISKKLPISAAVVKPPLRFEGQVLSQITGYPGWIYTEEDLEEIARLVQECGLEVSPVIQLMIALTGIHATKFTGYVAWKKKGRPGDLGKEEHHV